MKNHALKMALMGLTLICLNSYAAPKTQKKTNTKMSKTASDNGSAQEWIENNQGKIKPFVYLCTFDFSPIVIAEKDPLYKHFKQLPHNVQSYLKDNLSALVFGKSTDDRMERKNLTQNVGDKPLKPSSWDAETQCMVELGMNNLIAGQSYTYQHSDVQQCIPTMTPQMKTKAMHWIKDNPERLKFLGSLAFDPSESKCAHDGSHAHKLFMQLPDYVQIYIQNKYGANLCIGSDSCKRKSAGGGLPLNEGTKKDQTKLLNILIHDKATR